MLKFMPPSRVPPRSAVSLAEQHQAIAKLIIEADLSLEACHRISHHAAQMVRRIHADAKPSLREVFLAAYGLSNAEGIVLMRFAEALLRVPDASTIDALVADKIAPGTGQRIAVMPPQRW